MYLYSGGYILSANDECFICNLLIPNIYIFCDFSCIVNSELSNCCLTPIQHFVQLYHGENKLTIN